MSTTGRTASRRWLVPLCLALLLGGLTLPAPYGGKERQIMVDLDTRAMQSYGVSAKEIAETP